MTRSRKFRPLVLCGFAFGMIALLGNLQPATARLQYWKTFQKKYPNLVDEAKAKKCAVCHVPKMKKSARNDYGRALAKHVGENEKIEDDILEALDAAAKVENADGKTFGEIIESGKLPGSDEAAK